MDATSPDLTYTRMTEFLTLMRWGEYKTYIVIGGGQDFGSCVFRTAYGFPPSKWSVSWAIRLTAIEEGGGPDGADIEGRSPESNTDGREGRRG